ncbi:MAG TPA: VIT domain-containing protein [Kofleriaceae bacterium]|jgi:hypothetical protein
MALWNRSALAFFVAACSHTAAVGPSTPEVVPVGTPLTAATASVASQQIARADIEPPWSLTASDGSGLVLVRVEAKSVLQGPLAYTELHLWFHNPEARRREGTFQIHLPEHAAVSRFAMESDGQMLEAEVVEKQLARRAYDDFLHRRQDPALLEKAPGNQFTAKVFPIAPSADKHIVISYSQEIIGGAYVLPLRGLPTIAQADVELAVTGADGTTATQALHERAWQPDRDFVASAPAGVSAVSAGQLVATRVSVALAHSAAEPQHAFTLLVDTSASRALGYEAYVHSIGALIGRLRAKYGDAIALQVVAFDQDHETIFEGPASGWGAAGEQKLIERGAAGASDIGQLLASLAAQHGRHLVLVGDGVITAGLEHAELAAAVKRTGAERMDVVLAGGVRDSAAADELARAGLPHAGAVLDLDTGADAVAVALAEPVAHDVPVSVAGASWVFPRTLPTARAGTSTIVYARMATPAQSIDVALGGKTQHIALVAGTEPLLDRALASAEIEELEGQVARAPQGKQHELKAKLAELSVKHRVISDEASLLVLETDDDYARYGIDRKSLADILVVGPRGIEREHRTSIPKIATPAQTTPAAIAQPMPLAKKPVSIANKDSDDESDGDEDDDKPVDHHAFRRSERAEDKTVENFAADESSNESGGMASGAASATAAAPPPPPAPTPVPEPRPTTPMHHEPMPDVVATAQISQASGPRPMPVEQAPSSPDAWPPAGSAPALTGELADIEHAIESHAYDTALNHARDWHAKEPGNVLALIGLGDALEAKGSRVTAARVYGSIIDLFPGRADMRRFAGERIERLAKGGALPDLVLDTYRRAVVDRPDHLTGHRLYAYALERAGKHADAFKAVLDALDQPYRNDSYAGGLRTLGDDAGLIGASYAAAVPAQRDAIVAALHEHHLELATKPSTRFILYWETDANDVDFHIQDARGNHAYYAAPKLATGGELYADITTGYGPECFAIPGRPAAGPYHLSINYFSQGPMGYGMGLLEVETFDGKGKLAFDDRPYVIMNDHAFVDLGTF